MAPIYGVEAAEIPPPAPSPPPPTYTAKAVHFAGGAQGFGPTWLVIPSLTATDNSLFSCSIWFKSLCDPLNEGGPFWVFDAVNNYSPFSKVQNTAANLELNFAPNSGGQFRSRITGALLTSAAWHHFLFSANFTTGTPAFDLVVDGSHISYSATINVGNFFNWGAPSYPINNSFNGLDFLFGDDSGGGGPDCDVADVWFAPGVSLLSGATIPSATIAKFIDNSGKPVDPAGFPTSAVLFTGDSTTFATNLGTGGAATLNGTLTNASTHP